MHESNLTEEAMNENNGTSKVFFLGLLTGGAIGAMLALLYAPKSGKELRRDIKAKKDELITNAGTVIDEAREKLSEVSSEAKKRSEQVISDVKEKAGSLLQDADKVLSGVKDRANSVVDGGLKVKEAVQAGVDAFKHERNRS